MRLIWDSLNNQFLVGMDDGPLHSLPYPATANVRPTVVPIADVRQMGITANCTAAPTLADGIAEIGRVFTNASAVVP